MIESWSDLFYRKKDREHLRQASFVVGREKTILALFTFERSRKSSAFHGSATTRKRVKLCLFVSMPSSNTFIPYKSAAYLEQIAACPFRFSRLMASALPAVSSVSTIFSLGCCIRNSRHCAKQRVGVDFCQCFPIVVRQAHEAVFDA